MLSTCKAIHGEATSLMYEKNVFNFGLPNHAKDEAALARRLSEQCNRIFGYKDQDWRAEGPPLLKDSTFACFPNRIGARNAASLKAILFHATYSDVGRYQFSVAGRLLERHVPNIKFIRFDVSAMRLYEVSSRMPSPMNWTEQHDIPFPLIAIDADKELKRLCHTLTELVRGYPSLEELDCCGKGFTNRRKLGEFWKNEKGKKTN